MGVAKEEGEVCNNGKIQVMDKEQDRVLLLLGFMHCFVDRMFAMCVCVSLHSHRLDCILLFFTKQGLC